MQISTFRLLLMGLCKIHNVYTPTKNSKHLKYWSHQLDQQFAKISILKIIISEINCIKRYVIVILNIFKFTLIKGERSSQLRTVYFINDDGRASQRWHVLPTQGHLPRVQKRAEIQNVPRNPPEGASFINVCPARGSFSTFTQRCHMGELRLWVKDLFWNVGLCEKFKGKRVKPPGRGWYIFFFGHAASCSLDRPWRFEVQAWGSLSLTLRCSPGIFTQTYSRRLVRWYTSWEPGLPRWYTIRTGYRNDWHLAQGLGGFIFVFSRLKSRSDYPEREQIHLRWISCHLQSCWFQPWIVEFLNT